MCRRLEAVLALRGISQKVTKCARLGTLNSPNKAVIRSSLRATTNLKVQLKANTVSCLTTYQGYKYKELVVKTIPSCLVSSLA